MRSWLQKNDYGYVIACDRGMNFFKRNAICPDLILGDFDSTDVKTVDHFKQQRAVQIQQYPAQKDWTDTELAVRKALEYMPEQIDLVGATGSRLDHMLANLQLLARGLAAGVPIHLMDTHNRVRMIDRTLTLKKEEQYGDYVSLIPYTQTVTGVTLCGMKYPLTDAVLTADASLGISNEIVKETAEISMKSGKLLVIESKD